MIPVILFLLSIGLQLTAALAALLLIRTTGKKLAWLLLSSAMVLMAWRRIVSFIALINSGRTITFEFPEYIALAISALMLLGVFRIGAYFRSIQEAEQEREEMVETLRNSELQLRTLADSGQALIWTSGTDKLCDYFNKPWLLFTGRTLEQELGNGWAEGVHPEDFDRCLETYVTSFDKRERFSMEYRLRNASGEYRWILDDGTPRFDTKDNFLGYIGHCLDITEQKRIEERLQEKDEIFRLFMEYSPIYVFFKDEQLRVLQLSRNFEKMIGRPMEELLGKSMHDLFPADMARSILEDDRSILEQGHPREIVEELNGRIYITTKFPISRPGKPSMLAGFTIDITEKKKAEKALLLSEARLRTTLSNTPHVAIRWFDLDGRITYWNKASEVMYGWRADEVLGKTLDECIHTPQDNAEFLRILEGIRQTGKPFGPYEAPITRRDTSRGWVLSTSFAIPMGDNELGFVCMDVDITERKRTEAEREKMHAQLIQAQKMESVGRLAGGVAHDYNNMLSVILGYTELALKRVDISDPLHADLKEILNAATKSAEITRQLLAFARRQPISPKVLDLNETVASMLKMLQRLIGEDISLAWLPGSETWQVKADPSQIDQILANLCVNARDAITGVGRVSIKTENVTLDDAYCSDHAGFVPGYYVLLEVSDNGCGMDRETLDHLFEPFFTTKGTGQGTGLGLATVYGIVKQNGGFISVTSETEKGSTFRIFLPRHAGEACREELHGEKGIPGGRGETVLVVEDDISILNLTRQILKMLGYTVLEAATPGQALNLAKKHSGKIHVLLTDVVMPEMNGRDLAVQLVTLYPGLKVLYMSGYTADIIAHRGVLETGVFFIQKPFAIKDLALKVHEVLVQDQKNGMR